MRRRATLAEAIARYRRPRPRNTAENQASAGFTNGSHGIDDGPIEGNSGGATSSTLARAPTHQNVSAVPRRIQDEQDEFAGGSQRGFRRLWRAVRWPGLGPDDIEHRHGQ